MYFKAMQAIIALFTAIVSLIMPQTPAGTTPGLKLTNVNPNPIAQETLTQDLTVMTYNVKISGDGLRTVEKRAPHIINTVKEKAPDSVGFQETDKAWVEILAEGLTEYAHVEKYREDGVEKGEASAIFYLKDKYDLVESGHFWLSETPDAPSKGWDAACERICTYAILKDKKTGFVYAHFNVHFDHVGTEAPAKSIELVSAKIAEIAPDIPVVFTGDFNLNEGSENYNNLLACGLKDTKYLAKKHDNHSTYHGYHVVMPSTKPIDYIFVNGYVKSVESSKIDSGFVDHVLASDHFPITVKLTLFNGGK
ncbi:MAG: endonuclease/exonuclease/phosphatase family protein [Clostridia bacterium]|nr:endonuclease/exonuclease/phosphatase family protein [Clostridia bacterium]